MYEIVSEVKVSEVGFDKNMKLDALVALMGDCEQFQLDKDEFIFSYFSQKNFGVYLASRQIDIIKLPTYGQILKTKTFVYEIKPGFGYRNTFIYDSNDNVMVKCWGLGAFIDLNTQRIARVEKEFIDSYKFDLKQDIEYLPRNIVYDIEKAIETNVPDFYITNYFIDIYNHVNNAKYFSIACDCLPTNFNYSRIRVEYKKAAKQGDCISSKIIKNLDNIIVILFSKTNEIYSVIEFS